ncbi:autotransporter-associated N-terminal domain-containing protein [Fusobacterium polymorphum]|uniref:autotransporter-associated N-terminal domain-containing protein n=1 Tax=Fusobacterium nucleatum subsp. polymorphum TaxID=76857 RepID=UPI003AB3A363
MKNNLSKVENCLRSIARRNKSIKYSLGLAILFLMMGISAFSEEVVAQETVVQQEVMTTEQIATSKENLRNSVGSLQSKIDSARAENEKGLAGLKLELIQLMEQGDQVVKSPWMSWQFGANYMYSKWNGTYKGRGDKSEKYPYEGIFTRSENLFERVVSPLS